MIRRTNQGCWCRGLVREPHRFAHAVAKCKDHKRLNRQRNRDPKNRERVFDNGFTSEGKQQHQRSKQRRDRDRRQEMQELVAKPSFSLGRDQPFA